MPHRKNHPYSVCIPSDPLHSHKTKHRFWWCIALGCFGTCHWATGIHEKAHWKGNVQHQWTRNLQWQMHRMIGPRENGAVGAGKISNKNSRNKFNWDCSQGSWLKVTEWITYLDKHKHVASGNMVWPVYHVAHLDSNINNEGKTSGVNDSLVQLF